MIQPLLKEPYPWDLEKIRAGKTRQDRLVYLRFKSKLGEFIFVRKGTMPPKGFVRAMPTENGQPLKKEPKIGQSEFIRSIRYQIASGRTVGHLKDHRG